MNRIRHFFRNLTFKRVLKYMVLFVVFVFVWSNVWVYLESKDYVSDDTKALPDTKVGLLLGTSRLGRGGNPNPYFNYRIDAAVDLYNKGKIKHILISGDNGTKEYNEPEDMQAALVARGIPLSCITLDYAGFDTYDSVLRAHHIFGQSKFIVISQHFHNQRAVYIGRRFGLEVWGYDAQDFKAGIRTQIREYFARVKAYGEVKLGVDPYFLGQKVEIR